MISQAAISGLTAAAVCCAPCRASWPRRRRAYGGPAVFFIGDNGADGADGGEQPMGTQPRRWADEDDDDDVEDALHLWLSGAEHAAKEANNRERERERERERAREERS